MNLSCMLAVSSLNRDVKASASLSLVFAKTTRRMRLYRWLLLCDGIPLLLLHSHRQAAHNTWNWHSSVAARKNLFQCISLRKTVICHKEREILALASMARDDSPAARRPQQHVGQCAVKWDGNLKPKLAIMQTDRRTGIMA